MQYIISALHFPWANLTDCFGKVRNDLQLDGLELSFHESFVRSHCTRADLEEIAALKERYGLNVYAHLWLDIAVMGVAAAELALLYWLSVAVKTGVQGYVIHGGSHPDRDRGIDITRQTLARVVPRYEEKGVVLNLENHYAYDYKNCRELFSEAWEFLEVFQAVDSPALRFCFDTGHGHMTGNSAELLGELAPRLNHVHLADNLGEDDNHLPYREGTVNWQDVFDRLEEMDYDGPLCIEFPLFESRRPFDACMTELRGRWR